MAPTNPDLRWTGSPMAMSAALSALGHPAYAEEGTTRDPRIAAFGPAGQHIIAGRAVVFALLRVTEGAVVEPPPGVFAEAGALSEAATGVFLALPSTLSIRQFLLGLAIDEIITREEAIGAASTGALPGFVSSFFATLPDDQAFAAELTWRAMVEVDRDNPLLALLAAAIGMDSSAMDMAFQRWAAL